MRIFLTEIAITISSFSISVSDFSESSSPELVPDEVELGGGSGETVGLSVTNLH